MSGDLGFVLDDFVGQQPKKLTPADVPEEVGTVKASADNAVIKDLLAPEDGKLAEMADPSFGTSFTRKVMPSVIVNDGLTLTEEVAEAIKSPQTTIGGTEAAETPPESPPAETPSGSYTPEIVDLAGQEPAILPNPLAPAVRGGVAMEIPVSAENLPLPAPGPEPGDLVGEGALQPVKPTSNKEIARLWDGMMTDLSPGTRNAIWEAGFTDMPTLLATPRGDVVRPRGGLTEAQITELSAWLAERSLRLVEAPSRSQRLGGFAQRGAG